MTKLATRAVIVDDEEPARELLRALLAAIPDVVVVGEAGDGEAALRAIAACEPTVVFLDVQMPGVDGLEVAAALAGMEAPPLVVFVTAYDQYAIRAFELSACDYLLKPFDAGRLAATMQRVEQRAGSEAPARALRDALRQLTPREDAPLVLHADGRHLFVKPAEIEWIEMDGKEARVHLISASQPIVAREPLASLEARLDRDTFVRVHRSAIVNRNHIRELQPWFKGDFVAVMRRGARITTGRTYRDAVRRLIGG